jgi:hypothetical protein
MSEESKLLGQAAMAEVKAQLAKEQQQKVVNLLKGLQHNIRNNQEYVGTYQKAADVNQAKVTAIENGEFELDSTGGIKFTDAKLNRQ